MALYRWRKSTIKIAMTNIMYTYYSGGVIADSDPGRYGGWSYSKEIEFNQNGQVQLTNPTNVSDEGDIAVDLDAETYFWASTGQYSATLYFAQNATRVTYQENRSRFYLESGGPVVLGTPTQSPGTFASYVYSASESAYPNGGVQGDYYYDQMMEVSPPASITVPQMVMQGKQISISWAESDGASNYILERKSSTDSSWVQVYSGANLTFSETVGTWTSVQYRVKAGGDNLYGNYTTSSVVEVIESVSIAISGTDGDLGTLTSDVSYTVSSSGTSELTVVETINGTSRTFTAVNGATNKIGVVDLATGYGTISIQASTNPGSGVVSVTREWTYTKTAPTFPEQGSVADLTQQGKTIWAKTIAEAVRTPGIWGGNLGLALNTLAKSMLYDPADGTFTDISGGTIPMVSIETGSYMGTGTYGESNPNTLTTNGTPMVLFVTRRGAPQYATLSPAIFGCQSFNSARVSTTLYAAQCSWGKNSVSYYNSSSADYQLNTSGATFDYLIITLPGGDTE